MIREAGIAGKLAGVQSNRHRAVTQAHRPAARRPAGQHGTVLLGRGAWPMADVRLATKPVAVHGLGAGRGRVRSRTLAMETTARSRAPRRIVSPSPTRPGPAGNVNHPVGAGGGYTWP